LSSESVLKRPKNKKSRATQDFYQVDHYKVLIVFCDLS
jgi:hypothetical protein